MFTAHDAKTLKQALPELDFRQPAQTSEQLDSYLQHYGLKPDNRQAHDVHHAMGFFMCEGRRIACQYFSPQKPLATVVVLHGYYDHVGLYGHLIRYCLNRQFAVVAFDLPGHGLSDGEPAAIDSFSEYSACLEQCLRLMMQAALPRPFHAMGQSTGGSVLLDYCQVHCDEADALLDRVVLLAPLVRPSHWLRGQALHAVAKHLVSGIAREFAVNSHDEQFLQFLREQDPLQSRRLTVRWVSALKKWLSLFESRPPCQRSLAVIQGTEDTTVDWRYNLKAIERQFPEAKFALIKRGRHHLVNESLPYRERWMELLDGFL